MNLTTAAGILLMTCSTISFAASGIQKWTDKDGKVHYGDPATAPVAVEPAPKKALSNTANRTPKQIEDRDWNAATEKAERAPTGSAGRHLGAFAAPEPLPPTQRPYPVPTRSYSGGYNPSTSSASRQSEAERRQLAQEEARDNRIRELTAQCERQRGTDCRDLNTLKYMHNAERPARR